MSDVSADDAERLTLAELVSRIERQQAETRKFAAEQAKLSAEATKLGAEQAKLVAETAKFNRDRLLAPILALVATLGGIAALAPYIMRAAGR